MANDKIVLPVGFEAEMWLRVPGFDRMYLAGTITPDSLEFSDLESFLEDLRDGIRQGAPQIQAHLTADVTVELVPESAA